MSFSLSPQLRLIALFGALAMLIALAGTFFLLRGTLLSGEVQQVPDVVHQRRQPSPTHKAPAKQPAPAKSHPATKPEPKATATTPKVTATTPKVTATTPKVTAPKPPPTIKTPGVAANGLPIVIAQALRKNAVVVVALVVPGGEVDELTTAEARAGAKAAGVGFLTVNVLRNSVGRPLAQKLGVIQTPSLIVYRRPATVFVRFSGFTDRDTVIQAASSARQGR